MQQLAGIFGAEILDSHVHQSRHHVTAVIAPSHALRGSLFTRMPVTADFTSVPILDYNLVQTG